MNGNMLQFVLLAGVLIVVIVGMGGYYFWRLRVTAEAGWEDLLRRLIAIDHNGVDAVALDAIEPSGERRTDRLARELDPGRIWELLGGLEGVERLEVNSRVLVEMAAFLKRTYPEAAEVAENLRLQARELELHVARLRMAAEQGSLEFHISTYAQNAAIGYYLMERQLHLLCQRTNVPTFRPLQGSH
jgi:hypothetical protein